MTKIVAKPFHGYFDVAIRPGIIARPDPVKGKLQVVRKHTTIRDRTLSYRFTPHFHPFVGELVRRLIARSVKGLQAADTEYVRGKTLPDGKRPLPALYADLFDAKRYAPTGLVEKPYPAKELDFSTGGPYAPYNWELFFHVPLTVAIHLSRNQRFDEAQRWFHYVFDPTDDSDGPTPARFWKVKPFQQSDVELIEDVLRNLSTGDDPALQRDTINAIEAWKDAPFRPHVVARYRPTAYMLKTVMAYLDNLVAWGDSLFRQDTIEAINEATQVYVLAANLLGPRPQAVPRKGTVRPATYANLRADLDEFGNVLRKLETDIPFDTTPDPVGTGDGDRLATVRSLGRALYFCVPRNDKLLAYWDTVADRLFKIHNSLDIRGVFRQLPLFDPPIDPALLARAAAAGLDVAAVVSGASQPLPLVRFQLLLQKATEICQEVKSLGGQLLSTIEKEDNEALAILRSKHEKVILGLAETVKYQQWQESRKNREGVEKSLANALQRYVYYERLLGAKEADALAKVPALDPIDAAGLLKMKFKAKEPEVTMRDVEVDIAQDVSGDLAGRKVSSYEKRELELQADARERYDAATAMDVISSYLAMIPDFSGHATPIGVGGALKFGGQALSKMMSILAMVQRFGGDLYTYQANRTAKIGGYARREQEWAHQSNLAAGEITQMYKQLRASQIRESIAEREWLNHKKQIEHAEEIDRFLTDEKNGKRANRAFYAWMKREVKGLYGQCFQFAFDVAKKAERALQHELGNRDLSFVQYGYLAGKEGLLAGEKLHLDLKRMELAYHELNAREYELTKHVSLRQAAPNALVMLRATGRCTVSLPEELFDMDGPGHYFRRIKSVALSVPCVAGPYTSVNCTLTLQRSSIRRTPLVDGDEYARAGAEDPRFEDCFSNVQSIVTSTGQNDSGVFEANLRDERYLPFEGCGAVSEWQLELPAAVRQFDYDTIADVVLHVRYTAREGGGRLRAGAVANLTDALENARAAGSTRLFSARQEFPDAWAAFKAAKVGGNGAKTAPLRFALDEEHYPYWSKGRLGSVPAVSLFARASKAKVGVWRDAGATQAAGSLEKGGFGDVRVGALQAGALPKAPTGEWVLHLDDNSMDDVWMAVTWKK